MEYSYELRAVMYQRHILCTAIIITELTKEYIMP